MKAGQDVLNIYLEKGAVVIKGADDQYPSLELESGFMKFRIIKSGADK